MVSTKGNAASYNDLAKRKPSSMVLLPGLLKLRTAERRNFGSLSRAPPRTVWRVQSPEVTAETSRSPIGRLSQDGNFG